MARRAWQRKLAEGGLAAVTWPADYGGQGLGPLHQVVVNQEIGRAGVPGIFDVIGVGMLGPTLIAHGTEEQKQRHLGPMLNADEVWCQLFSEPAAGSDLAGIQSRAKQEEDGSWRLSGQKVWTTNAQYAAYGLLLARTDADVPKHKGLTMFIVPMDAEGVTIRPLRQISGEAHFNEVFFDDVALDAGLRGRAGQRRLGRRADHADVRARGDRPRRRGLRLARRPLRRGAARRRGRDARPRGPPPLRRDRRRLPRPALHRLPDADHAAAGRHPRPGGRAGQGHDDQGGDRGRRAARRRARARRASDDNWGELVSDLPGLKSAGGTEEILRNMVGERVLGLPPEPRLDKGIPFSELRAKEREAAGAAS